MATHLAALSFDSPIPTRRPPPTARPIEPITDPTEAYLFSNRYPPTPTRRPTPTHPATPTRRPTPTRRASFDLAILASSPAQVTSATEVFYFPLGMQDYWHKDYTWKGVTGEPEYDIPLLNVNWWHGWGEEHSNPTTEMDDQMRRMMAPIMFCPKANRTSSQDAANQLAQNAQRLPGRVWLLYNEPDYPYECLKNETTCHFNSHGCNPCAYEVVGEAMATRGYDDYLCEWNQTTPTPEYIVWTPTPTPTSVVPTTTVVPMVAPPLIDAMAQVTADEYALYYRAIKEADPTARVFCCGNFHTHPTEWWEAFLLHLEIQHPDVEVDGVHLHTYPWSKSTNCGYPGYSDDRIEVVWGACIEGKLDDYWLFHQAHPMTKDKPIWISEYGFLGDSFSPNVVRTFLMEPMVHWIGKNEYEARPGNTATPDPYNHHYTAVSWFTSYTSFSAWASTNLLETPLPPGAIKTHL